MPTPHESLTACSTGLVLLALGLALSGCEREGPAERAGKNVDQAAKQAGDNIEKAGKDVKRAVEPK